MKLHILDEEWAYLSEVETFILFDWQEKLSFKKEKSLNLEHFWAESVYNCSFPPLGSA